MSDDRSTLVVTMGGQAQVVTFALDALLAKNERVHQVIVLHLSPENPRIAKALAQLAREFVNEHYAYANVPMRYRALALGDARGVLHDIRTESDAEVVWQAVYALIAELKTQAQTLHLCIAGGRRIIGLMAMSAAMLLFDHQDRLWHLFTPDELRQRAFEGAVMHVPPDADVRLIQVPLSPWGAYFPSLRALVGLPSAGVVVNQQTLLTTEERVHAQRVLAQLSERQREVLRAFASGLTPQQVAERLCISLKTVDSHKTVILDLCRNEWQMAPGTRLDYHFLRDKFRDVEV
ncbi:MAG: CRISPR-associated ring nuclease [Anaerolineae bacterium]|nr:CRISPR-associated ring nuclease [Anaerolineae bacterium]